MKRAELGNKDQADSGGESGSGQLALGAEMTLPVVDCILGPKS